MWCAHIKTEQQRKSPKYLSWFRDWYPNQNFQRVFSQQGYSWSGVTPWSKISPSNLWSNKALAIQLWLHSGHETLLVMSHPKSSSLPQYWWIFSIALAITSNFKREGFPWMSGAGKGVLQSCVLGPIYVFLSFLKNLKFMDVFKLICLLLLFSVQCY